MTLKSFNLEDAKRGEPIITRDGKRVSELHHFPTANPSGQIAAVIEGVLFAYNINGQVQRGELGRFDLFMAPKTIKRWVNVYDDPRCCSLYMTKLEADINAQTTRIACVEVEFTEGEGLQP